MRTWRAWREKILCFRQLWPLANLRESRNAIQRKEFYQEIFRPLYCYPKRQHVCPSVALKYSGSRRLSESKIALAKTQNRQLTRRGVSSRANARDLRKSSLLDRNDNPFSIASLVSLRRRSNMLCGRYSEIRWRLRRAGFSAVSRSYSPLIAAFPRWFFAVKILLCPS